MKKNLLLILLTLSCCSMVAQDREKFLLDSLEKTLAGVPDTIRMKRIYQFAKDNLYTYPKLTYQKAEEASKLAHKYGDKMREAMNYSLMGVVEKNNGEYKKALEWDLKSLKLNEEIQDKKSLAISNNDIGVLYKVMKDYPTALVYYERSLALCKEINMGNGVALTLGNIGTIYNEMQQEDKALDYYKQSLAKAKEINSQDAMVNALSNIGELYAKRKDPKSALPYFLDAIKIDRANEDKYGMILSSINLGSTYKDLGNYPSAMPYMKDAIRFAKEIGASPLLVNGYESMSGLYESMGDTKNSLLYHKLFSELKDSLLNTERTEQLAEMQTKYETEKKEQEIGQLTQDNKISALQLQQRTTQIVLLIIAVVFILVVSLLLYNRNKIKQRETLNAELLRQEQLRNKAIIITQENERKRISEELHDGLGQMMSAVKLNVAALEENLKEKNPQFHNAIQLIDDSCRELRNISHNMMPGILIKAGLVPAVKEFVDKINSSGTISIRVEAEESKVRLGDTIEINFFRIIQELITNIIKYAKATQVQVTITMEENILSIMIEDNGKGFDKDILKTSSGNGWNNINSRLNLLHGKIEIDSHPGQGTVIFIETPLNVLV
jgi:two-component system NarL family sensor kinase